MFKKSKPVLERLASSRSAQGGMNAAILVAIIAGLIILYIVFLPASQREALLQNGTEDTGNGDILLRVNIGSIGSSDLENSKTIPDAFLIETRKAREIASFNRFIVKNGGGDKKTNKVDFDIEDSDNTDNAILSFSSRNNKGVLTIKLNGVVVFENEISSATIEPVRLGKRLLQKTNSLEFSVSSVGARFWTTNEYSLENVKVIADITDTSRQESTNLFTLTDSEYASMERATLRFYPYCSSVNNVGLLEIFINSKRVFSSVPSCDSQYKQSIPKSALNEGENNIVFKTTKGSYSVEQIKISLEFKEPSLKTYYFKIDSQAMSGIRNGDKDVSLSIKFVDDGNQKRLKLDVNGNTETIDTNRPLFTKNINSRVSEGNNYVRLEPLDDVEISELKIELV